jgi:hypothetical protein
MHNKKIKNKLKTQAKRPGKIRVKINEKKTEKATKNQNLLEQKPDFISSYHTHIYTTLIISQKAAK